MKVLKTLAIAAVVLALAALTPNFRNAQDTASTNPGHITAEHQAKAKEIFKIDCTMCHGEDGKGQTDLNSSMALNLKDWTKPETFANKTDKQLFEVIRNGGDKMPPESMGRANDEVVWNLVHYIRTLAAAPQAAPAAPAATPAPAK